MSIAMKSESASNSVSSKPSPPVLRILKIALGYLIAAACLVWVFHDIHINRLFQNVARINWGWVALGIIFDVLSYISQGFRWHFLLRPVGNVPVLRTTQATYAGLFINEVLPMRIGEVARAYLVSRWASTEFIRVIPSMALERLFEGIWLAIGIGITALLVPLPKNLVKSGDILGIIVLVATGLFVYFVFRKHKEPAAHAIFRKHRMTPPKPIQAIFQRLGSGFKDIGLSHYSYLAFGVSLMLFVFQAFSFWFIMLAYGLHFSFWIGAAIFLIVHFGTALPNAPANVGSYQFFCVLGLTLFGVDKTLATGFSLVVFILLTLPLLMIGFFALGQSGMTLSSIKMTIKGLKIST
jgi:uncharacterized protein (TIRG00374 family)